MAYTKAKTPAAPKREMTQEEKEQQALRVYSMKREQFATSILFGMVHNPALAQMANIHEVISGDGYTQSRDVDLTPVIIASIAAADKMLDALYPNLFKTEESK